MTEKRLCKFSLTGFQCLVFYRLIQDGKRIILVGDNKFKVVDGYVEWLRKKDGLLMMQEH